MSRSSNKRDELLKRVVHYLETRGIADLSLSPLAAELGTSKRMLLYYFGSRDELIVEAIAASRPDVAGIFGDVRDAADLRVAAQRLWQTITTGEQQRPIRILFQVLSLAPTQPDRYAALAAEAVTVMIDPLVAIYRRLGYSDDQAQARASLLISGLRGLCQDQLVTGNTTRTDAAALALIDSATTPPDPRPDPPR
ncbi:TetR family transcriptional regulator [Saccharopolyspora sp. NPDC002686]|uniref:TetR/AcrR family transcriptional regulator n=1 Tax=Saccharopolyspora sp. NPDC002686 TaxID=3154541 RepID=UPI00331BA426